MKKIILAIILMSSNVYSWDWQDDVSTPDIKIGDTYYTSEGKHSAYDYESDQYNYRDNGEHYITIGSTRYGSDGSKSRNYGYDY